MKNKLGLSSQDHCPILVSLVIAKYDALVRFVHYAVEAILDWAIKPYRLLTDCVRYLKLKDAGIPVCVDRNYSNSLW